MELMPSELRRRKVDGLTRRPPDLHLSRLFAFCCLAVGDDVFEGWCGLELVEQYEPPRV